MTSPKLSHTITFPDGEEGRMYSRQPGGTPEMPSITTVMSMVEGGMEWWRGLCAGQEAVRLASLIAQRQQELDGAALKAKEKQMVEWIDQTAVRDMNAAAERGDAIHNYAEMVCRSMIGESVDLNFEREKALELIHKANQNLMKPPEPSVNPGFLNSVHTFLTDFKVEPLVAEGTVWNDAIGYAGTNDLLCRIDGRLTLLDWKTKKKVKNPSDRFYKPSIQTRIGMQLLAAKHGEQYYDESTDQWAEWQGQNAQEFVGVALGPNGYEAMRVVPNDLTWDLFRAAKIAWNWHYAEKMDSSKFLEPYPMSPNNPWRSQNYSSESGLEQ